MYLQLDSGWVNFRPGKKVVRDERDVMWVRNREDEVYVHQKEGFVHMS